MTVAVSHLAGAQTVLGSAVVENPELRSVVLVLLASTLGALLSRLHGRVVLPTVVIEIVLGMVIGPDVLDLASAGASLQLLANFGLAFLFFFAGLEVVERRVPRRALRLGTVGWLISIVIGLSLGIVLDRIGLDAEWWLLGVALCTTALGTLVPILSDAGVLGTPLGHATLGTGVAGEFWPIVFISVFLTGVYGAFAEVLLLVGFGAVVDDRGHPGRPRPAAEGRSASCRRPFTRRARRPFAPRSSWSPRSCSWPWMPASTSSSARSRPGSWSGSRSTHPTERIVRIGLEGIGFGFLIPIYFVVTGMTLDLDSLLSPDGIALAALFLALFLVVRGTPALLWAHDLGKRETLALALCGATALPLVVAIVGIGTERGAISTSVGASMILGGIVSVLVYPLIATQPASGSAAAELSAPKGREI